MFFAIWGMPLTAASRPLSLWNWYFIYAGWVNRKLAEFAFCKKGQPTALETKRYHEILKNLA
jgi:hypothetical protein